MSSEPNIPTKCGIGPTDSSTEISSNVAYPTPPMKPEIATATALNSSIVDSDGNCTHPAHDRTPPNISSREFIRKLQERIEASRSSGNITVKINAEMNWIFVQRLAEIQGKSDDAGDLELETYMEWIQVLMELNNSIHTSMDDLNRKVRQRLASVSCGNLFKCRKDIGTLVHIIQKGFHDNDWDMNVQFETLPPDILHALIESEAESESEVPKQELKDQRAQIVPAEGSCITLEWSASEETNFSTKKCRSKYSCN